MEQKKYKIIYADPAWSYNKKVGQGIADDIYQTMELEDIKRLPIKSLSEEDSVLFIWGTFPMLKECLEVIEAWGFTYKTCAFNWIKLNKNGTPFFGIGRYTKSNSEVCFLAIKGKGLDVKSNYISQVVMTTKDKHSKKPNRIYSLIEELYGDVERIELFARERRQGWDVWGNEAPNHTQALLTQGHLIATKRENQGFSPNPKSEILDFS